MESTEEEWIKSKKNEKRKIRRKQKWTENLRYNFKLYISKSYFYFFYFVFHCCCCCWILFSHSIQSCLSFQRAFILCCQVIFHCTSFISSFFAFFFIFCSHPLRLFYSDKRIYFYFISFFFIFFRIQHMCALIYMLLFLVVA